jgi:hypothetical protein
MMMVLIINGYALKKYRLPYLGEKKNEFIDFSQLALEIF